MKNYKNYLIALLTGLLVLTLTTQPSIGAGKSKEAKTVEYAHCIVKLDAYNNLTDLFKVCAKYRP